MLVCAAVAGGTGIVNPTSTPSSAALAASPRTISVVAENQPIRALLLRLAKSYGLNIVVNGNVSGRVTVALRDVSVDEVLTAVVKPLGYAYARYGRLIVVSAPGQGRFAGPRISPTPATAPVVVGLSIIPAQRAAAILQRLYPRSRITIDRNANALIVVASAEDAQAMRTIVQGIDVKNPTTATIEAIQLRLADPKSTAEKVKGLYPASRVSTGPNKTLLVEATPQDMVQIKSIIGAMDTSTASPTPPAAPAEAVRITQARPRDVARAVAHEFPSVRASVSGSSVIVAGSADDVAKAKTLIALIDQPASSARYTQVYRLHSVDAKSVAGLISRSFRDISVTADEDLNAISVTATASEQQRIGDAVTQLDSATGPTVSAAGGPPVQQPGAVTSSVGPGGTSVEVVTLKAAVPGPAGAASTTATDIAGAVTQALGQSTPDLHITVPANSTQLVLTGSSYSIRLARQLIDQLDVAPPQVVLDTEVLELDETVAKNLGLYVPGAVISTTYSEIPPAAGPSGTPPPLLGIQPFTRSGVAISAELHFLVQNGTARVLADPRVTTISGRTASIRAGDTISILTTTGGGAGSIATTQLQTFQTGVTLDITPVVNAGNSITVTLHPVVNSESGLLNNVPQISTRDTQTTVNLQDNQTLVIGGLIQENTTRTQSKLPVLGDLPLVGRVFRNSTLNHSRNELIIVVTPHVLGANALPILPGPPLPGIPQPAGLPTLPPGTVLPPPSVPIPTPPPAPIAPAPQPAVTPAPSAVSSPGVVSGASPSPEPTPSAFAGANVYTYGHVPTNTFASPTDPVQIFYATFSPTILHNGTLVHISAITTTNVNNLIIGYSGFTTQLAQISPGKWQSAYNFNTSGVPVSQSNVQLTLTASRTGGQSASIQIPVSVTQ